MKLPDTFVEELRKRVDIVDIISEHVQLRRAGRSFTGLCPFHNERSPSFSVSPERQMFHCFGCGAGGTVFRFVMDIESISFLEAVIQLANRVGTPMPDGISLANVVAPASERHQLMRDAHELTAKLYSYILMNTDAGVQALNYLQNRGISRQVAVNFRMGYAPDAKDTVVRFLTKRGFESQLLIDCGLAVSLGEQMVDRFKGRVMVPISDIRGQVVAFGGRTMVADAKPKYLNSPDSEIFHKGDLLFNHSVARKMIRTGRTAILFEGYMDTIAAAQANVLHVVASMGTALSAKQAQLLRRDADTVVIAYDGDKAGLSATERSIPILTEAGLHVRVVRFPQGMDPDEFIRSQGAAAFARQITVHAESPVQFLLGQLRHQADLLSAVGRTEFLRQSLSLLGERATPIEQETELRNLSHEFNVTVETLKEELRMFAKPTNSKYQQPRPASTAERQQNVLPKGYVQAGNRLLQALMWDESTCQLLIDNNVDELGLPEQTALLAILYAWRLSAKHPDLGLLFDTLEDDLLLRLASSLMVEEPPALTKELLLDYIRTVELHRMETVHKSLLESLVQAQLQGNREMIGQIKLQVDELQSQIAARKVPHSAGNASGVKEAGKK